MNDLKPIPPNRGIVTLDDATKERVRRQLLATKGASRIPDEVWLTLQECGEKAVEHLHRLLNDPVFAKRKIHEQIRIIELALMRSYGSPEGPIKQETLPPREGGKYIEQGDAIRRLAKTARLPEMQPTRRKSPL